MTNKKNLVINFDFEEVNSAVFRNAQIYAMKKSDIQKYHVHVITPKEFSFLFNRADSLILLDEKEFPHNYREILEFKGHSRTDVISNSILNNLLKFIKIQFIRNYIYSKLFRSARQQKFYVKSGVERKKLADIKKCKNFSYIRVGDYFDLSKMNVVEFDLGKWFSSQFNLLKEMIEDGALYRSYKTSKDLLNEIDDEKIRSFINYPGPKVIMRTRNFKNKAIEHNSKFETFNELAIGLISKGVFVLNLGYPLLKLRIEKNHYAEIEHNLSLENQIALCQLADINIMTAEGGLFVAFAASAINILQIDEEWSVTNKEINVNLFEARKNLGIDDLDVRKEIQEKNYLKAIELIMPKLGNLRKPTSSRFDLIDRPRD